MPLIKQLILKQKNKTNWLGRFKRVGVCLCVVALNSPLSSLCVSALFDVNLHSDGKAKSLSTSSCHLRLPTYATHCKLVGLFSQAQHEQINLPQNQAILRTGGPAYMQKETMGTSHFT